MNSKKELQQLLSDTLKELGVDFKAESIPLERPAQSTHGEYATSLALSLFSKQKKDNPSFSYNNPRELAESISIKLNEKIADKSGSQLVKSVSVAGPGFINFTFSDQFYLEVAQALASSQESVYKPSKQAGSVIIEYVSPNTNKPLHIGHVRNAALGSAMGKILEKVGWNVHLGIINNDRGLHITKSMWAYLMFGQRSQQVGNEVGSSTIPQETWQTVLSKWIEDNSSWLTPQDMTDKRLQKPDHFVGFWYQKGDTLAEDLEVQKAWTEMLQAWEGKDLPHHKEVHQLWQHLNNLFYLGFKETSAVIGAIFDADEVNFESDIYEAGKEIVLQGAEQGVFEKLPDGAVKVNLEKFKLPDKILLRRDGTGIYMTFDIELTRRRFEKKADKVVWVVGMDQQLYFQQLFAVAEILGYGNQEKFFHFAYGMVRLPEGKMSSRKGRVIYADDLLETAQEKAKEIMQQVGVAKDLPPEEFNKVAQSVGIGAVKWTMLAQEAVSEITFNIEESVSFTGFAGPYIQYTIARTHSVFKKAESRSIAVSFDAQNNISKPFDDIAHEDEKELLVSLSKYFDVVERSAAEWAPHYIATYLHELAQRFNTFYAHHTIVGDDAVDTQRRLLLTKAVQNVLTEGLNLLGINPVERM